MDMAFMLSMFPTGCFDKCRLIMVPVMINGDWSFYIYDFKDMQVRIFDPLLQVSDEFECHAKHQEKPMLVLRDLKECGEYMGIMWGIDTEKWHANYYLRLHGTCVGADTGVYILHDARTWLADDFCIGHRLCQRAIDTTRKQILMEVMLMKTNEGDLPAFMVLETSDSD